MMRVGILVNGVEQPAVVEDCFSISTAPNPGAAVPADPLENATPVACSHPSSLLPVPPGQMLFIGQRQSRIGVTVL